MGHSNDLIAVCQEMKKISPKQIWACLLLCRSAQGAHAEETEKVGHRRNVCGCGQIASAARAPNGSSFWLRFPEKVAHPDFKKAAKDCVVV
jgi:hypothetical protein